MPLHSALTGAELHEPKGVASASVDTVYVASGAGTGTWQKVGSSQINSSSVLNLNKAVLTFTYDDVGTAGSQFVPMPAACTVNKITAVIQTIPTTNNTVLTIRNDAGTSMGTITILAAAAAGSVGTLSPSSNNTFTADTKLQIDTDGGAANNPDVTFAISYTLT